LTAVLVLGGAGYIGSHACKSLALKGYTPITYDDLSLGHESFVQWGPLVRGDIADTPRVIATIREFSVVSVLHFAAVAYVGESVVKPAKYYAINVRGTMSVLNALRTTDCKTIVFSSTCAVYGEPNVIPIAEDAPKSPINPYGRSKLFCEGMLTDYGAAYGIRSITLRYFNAAGASPAGEIGELRDPETHLIPRALMYLQGHVTDFVVYGNDFSTPDGTAIRDYIHVTDLAEAHVLAMELLQAGYPSNSFNLGSGVGHSVLAVLSCIESMTGRPLPQVVGARRQGDPAALVADPRKARTIMGFEATQPDLTNIVRTAWNWHQKAHPRVGVPVAGSLPIR
jgi:UDP-glucose 4-epimerase/UDP-arabinose 4-epimerase